VKDTTPPETVTWNTVDTAVIALSGPAPYTRLLGNVTRSPVTKAAARVESFEMLTTPAVVIPTVAAFAIETVRPEVSEVVVTVSDASETRNFRSPPATVDASFEVSEKVLPAPATTVYAVPDDGANDTNDVSARPAADAGATAETDRATNAPNAAPLRVRFLDMYVSFFSWFIS
jgi:hypothetical protein